MQSGEYRQHEGDLQKNESSSSKSCCVLSCPASAVSTRVLGATAFPCHRGRWLAKAGSSKFFVSPYLVLKYNTQELFPIKINKNPSCGSGHTSRIWVKFLNARILLSITLNRKSWHFLLLFSSSQTCSKCAYAFMTFMWSHVCVQGVSWRLTTGWEGSWVQEAAQGIETGC